MAGLPDAADKLKKLMGPGRELVVIELVPGSYGLAFEPKFQVHEHVKACDLAFEVLKEQGMKPRFVGWVPSGEEVV